MIISSGIHYIKDLIASVVEEDHIKTNCSQMLKSGNFLTYSEITHSTQMLSGKQLYSSIS